MNTISLNGEDADNKIKEAWPENADVNRRKSIILMSHLGINSFVKLMKFDYNKRIWLATLGHFGGTKFIKLIKNMMEVLSLIGALIVGFATIDLPHSYTATNEYNNTFTGIKISLITGYGILSAVTSIFSLFAIIVSVLVYIQVSFYDDSEISQFVNKFSIVFIVPILFVVLSILGTITCINLKMFILYDNPLVWKVVAGVTIGIGFPVLLVYPVLDNLMRKTRFKAIEKTLEN